MHQTALAGLSQRTVRHSNLWTNLQHFGIIGCKQATQLPHDCHPGSLPRRSVLDFMKPPVRALPGKAIFAHPEPPSDIQHHDVCICDMAINVLSHRPTHLNGSICERFIQDYQAPDACHLIAASPFPDSESDIPDSTSSSME
jgi:hypothetical protein